MMPAHQVAGYTNVTNLVTPYQNALPVYGLLLDWIAIRTYDESPCAAPLLLGLHLDDFHHDRVGVRQPHIWRQMRHVGCLCHVFGRHWRLFLFFRQLARFTTNRGDRVEYARAKFVNQSDCVELEHLADIFESCCFDTDIRAAIIDLLRGQKHREDVFEIGEAPVFRLEADDMNDDAHAADGIGTGFGDTRHGGVVPDAGNKTPDEEARTGFPFADQNSQRPGCRERPPQLLECIAVAIGDKRQRSRFLYRELAENDPGC